MKKKSASQSTPARRNLGEGGFFNLRVLIGLFMALAGVFMALLGFGVFSGVTTAQAQPRYKLVDKDLLSALPPGFDCSKVHELGIDKQENMRAGAIMIACGLSEGGSAPGSGTSGSSIFSRLINNLLPAPLFIGGTDVDVILPDSTYPKVTQSESMEWGGPNNTWVVNYNDSRTSSGCYSGLSYSTDNGVTWHAGQPLCSGHGTNYGDPIVVYNAHLGMWFAGDLATGCGGQGVGLWTSPDGVAWTVGACAANLPANAGDRESMWVDNNPASPFYGRMYISYNNFNVGGGALYVVYSDNGTTWNTVQLNPGFIRDIQVTGDLQGSGYVYVATMNEGGGGLTNRQSVMYRSINGGVTWTSTNAGPPFQGPGRSTNGYFALAFSSIWRHMGWGEPAASGNVVSLDYAACGQNVVCSGATDHGDVYYIRSTDAGLTWGTPVKLNTDAGTAMQWQPSLTATQSGALFASWYDEREVNGGADLNCTVGSSSQPCYRRWGRVSLDNGATWQPDDMVGRALSPLPAQPDPNVQATYEGDYDYHSALGQTAIGGWTDGRVIISSTSQQDVFVNLVTPGFGVASSVPACNSVINTQPVDFVMNLTDAVNTSTVQASDFTVNGTPSNLPPTFAMSNSQVTFHFSTSPVTLGTNTMHIPAGAFNRQSDGLPNVEFLCSFCYAVTPLMVTTTNPPVGGTFTGPGTRTLDVNFNLAVDENSVQNSDLMLSGIPGTVTGHTFSNNDATVTFTINFTGIFSGTLTASIAAGAITANGCNPNAAFSGNYNYVGSFCDSGIIQNGGFETGGFTPGWIIDSINPTPVVTNTVHHSGTYSAVAGGATGGTQFCGSGNEPSGDSSFYQQFTVPAGGGTLSFWHQDCTTDTITFDWQDAYITNTSGTILQTIFHVCDTTNGFVNTQVNMAAYAGQTVRIKFLVHSDAFGDLTAMYVDDVGLFEPCAPMAQDAFSRKVHGGAGTFNIPLPLTGNVGVECRSGGATNDYQMIIDFATTVTVESASVTSGTGMVSSFTGSGTSQITVNLTGVTDAQRITMTLHNVNNGTSTGDVPVSMGVLVGDVNGNAVVNASDVSLTKSQVGNPVTSSNFREDVNANGTISATDVALVKSEVGTALPP
jgi:hypothetical protein